MFEKKVFFIIARRFMKIHVPYMTVDTSMGMVIMQELGI